MQWFCWHVAAKMSLGFLCLFLVFSTASCIRRENKKEKQVAVLATAGNKQHVRSCSFRVLMGVGGVVLGMQVAADGSFAFHKVSVTIYNISNAKNVDPGKFPMHYCYCLNNATNDLTDFTALLVDIIGNSTSYLTEIFKSTSILSVRQSNDSDCIYICVMTGQTGKNLSDFWEILEKSPVINYTFSSNTSSDLDLESIFSSFVKLQEEPNKTLDPSAEHVWTFKTTRIPLAQKGEEMPTMRFPPWPKTVGAKGSWFPSAPAEASRSQGMAGSPPTPGRSSVPSPAPQPRPTDVPMFWMQTVSPQETSKRMQTEPDLPSSVLPMPPSYRPGVTLKLYSATRCPQAILRESHVTSPPVTLVVQRINPCVMELCRFFQLCLCVGQRRHSRKEAMRYCVEYYSWFVKNASYVCERVKRVTYSHTLKQKCLKNICASV
ncbi:HERV-H LTR-associating protein 1 [Empidonax traillii]|uniref:HERV-H LTR-associating protein 1 n=1 Tax=Empidonax traillii TaxID=164674 RepID=UPI000FFD73D2|nr:HERV-H LTR-associating protein 1 [Empidonax traillii]